MKVRQDAWSEENDLLLAETVLRHVREGSTQLNAFEEVGDELNRTSAACGFRWNAVVRQQYEKALQLAKKQRKQRHRMLGKERVIKKTLYKAPAPTMIDTLERKEEESQAVSNYIEGMINQGHTNEDVLNVDTSAYWAEPSTELSLDQVILYLQSLSSDDSERMMLKQKNARLQKENLELVSENNTLKHKLSRLEKDSRTMQEDYETFMKIMNRARKQVLFEDEDSQIATSFKMDRNGNLEKIAE
jgi:prespore-specific regulator